MKIPFYTLLGPLFKSNHRDINRLCGHPFLTFSHIYTGVLGLIGVILSVLDIIKVVKNGPILPNPLMRNRIKNGNIAAPEVERDLKLVFLSLSLEYYVFLLIGTLSNNYVLYLPFLILYAFIIILEFSIFVLHCFTKSVNFSRLNVVTIFFVLYNWTSVFCAFSKSLRYCDM